MIQRPHKSKEKYGLLDMKKGQHKDFNIALYSKLRLACHFTSKKHNRQYCTRKLTYKNNKPFIRVHRVK